jgi:hypothetical protein
VIKESLWSRDDQIDSMIKLIPVSTGGAVVHSRRRVVLRCREARDRGGMYGVDRKALPRVLGPELLGRLGISRAQVRTELRHGAWQCLATGIVLTRPDEPTREDWADVGVLLAGRGAAVSGWDGLRARGLGKDAPPDCVLVLSPSAMNRVVGGVRIRRTERAYASRAQPLGALYELTPLAPVVRAVADYALDCRDLGTLRTVIGAAVHRRLCTVPGLLGEYEAGPRNRSKLLRLALADAADGARSAAEATAARRLARGPLPPFELNVPIVDERGRLLYVVDLLWRELRAALEIDSREYHFGVDDWEATLDRHNQLTRYGLAITHYPPRHVTRRGSTLVPDVADWLARRAIELRVPLPAGRGIRRPPLDEAAPPFVVQTKRP